MDGDVGVWNRLWRQGARPFHSQWSAEQMLHFGLRQRLAVSWIDQHGLARRDGMELLAQAPPLEPMLVSVTGRRNRPYYLVPFGMDRGEDPGTSDPQCLHWRTRGVHRAAERLLLQVLDLLKPNSWP